MNRKLLGIPGIALTLDLGLAACGPPRGAVYGGAVIEVESEPPAPQVEVQTVSPYPSAVWI
jgi:hypothetical protein